jgi:hypothetical protein
MNTHGIRQCINYNIERLSSNNVGISVDSGDIFLIDSCVNKYDASTTKFWNNILWRAALKPDYKDIHCYATDNENACYLGNCLPNRDRTVDLSRQRIDQLTAKLNLSARWPLSRPCVGYKRRTIQRTKSVRIRREQVRSASKNEEPRGSNESSGGRVPLVRKGLKAL